MESDGFCDQCRVGFVDKLAYHSRLTYHIATGDVKEPSQIKCTACKSNMQEGGWCHTCDTGMIGNVAIRDKKIFKHAAEAFDLFKRAIAKSRSCELCAVAMITGAKCPKCSKPSVAKSEVKNKP